MLSFTVFDCSDEKVKCIEKLDRDYGRERLVAEHGGLASAPLRVLAYPRRPNLTDGPGISSYGATAVCFNEVGFWAARAREGQYLPTLRLLGEMNRANCGLTLFGPVAAPACRPD